MGWGARIAALVTVAVAVTLAPPSPAGAHPFGPPPTALVSASGQRVLVEWDAAPDDVLILGMAVGVLDDGSLDRYLEGPVQTAPSAAEEAELSTSPQLRDYLLDRIVVSQGGRPCDGTVESIGSVMADGARVTYDCPRPIGVVDLRIAMLHDVHDAYRTFAITEGRGAPAQSVFTVESPEQRWDFSTDPAAASPRRSLTGPAAGVAGAVALGVLATLAWRRRRPSPPVVRGPGEAAATDAGTRR